MKRIWITAVLVCTLFASHAQERKISASINKDAEMDKFVTELMNKMTVEEKIGQLNLVSVGFDVTGPIVSQNVEEKIRKGNVGGVFNTFTPAFASPLVAASL